MVRIQEDMATTEKGARTICPNLFRKLKMNIERSGTCIVFWNGEDGFEVQKEEDRRLGGM
jgi:hypothetical protein